MSNWPFLDQHRVQSGLWASDPSYGFNGAFQFAIPGEPRRVCAIASNGMGWEHVSVSYALDSRSIPSWAVMCAVKDLFWEPEDTVIQIHPAKSVYVNCHPGCLHLWRCIDGREQPLPLPMMVGPVGIEKPRNPSLGEKQGIT